MVENLSIFETVNEMYENTCVHVLREKQELFFKVLLQKAMMILCDLQFECLEASCLFLYKGAGI